MLNVHIQCLGSESLMQWTIAWLSYPDIYHGLLSMRRRRKSPKMAWWRDRLQKIIGFPCVNDYKDIEKSFLSLAGTAIKKNPEWSLSHFYELPSSSFSSSSSFLGSNCNTTTRRLLLLFPKTSCWWLSAVAGVRHASHPVDYSLSPTIFLHTIYPTLRVSQNPDPLQ